MGIGSSPCREMDNRRETEPPSAQKVVAAGAIASAWLGEASTSPVICVELMCSPALPPPLRPKKDILIFVAFNPAACS